MSSSIVKGICTAGIAAACAFGLMACSSGSGGTGGVAATVNGVEIAEDDVTAYIDNVRAQVVSYSDAENEDDAWGEYLATYGYTPESLRETVIENQFVQRELIRQGAEEQGIVVDEATIDGYVDQMRAYYDSDEAWRSALEQLDMTEDEYRESIELALLNQDLQDAVAPETEPTEEELVAEANENLSAWNGAKKSSHILFSSDDEATAQSVLDQINAGTLDFATAAQEYSTDGSASDGGNVGWDKLTTFVDEYQDALDSLSVGQVSGLVTSQYGIHIIMCTDEFIAPESISSTSEIPSEFVDSIRTTIMQSNSSTAYQEWLDNYRESADVVINGMPADVPYNIDMTAYTTDESTDDAATTDETSTDGTEGAEDEATREGSDAAANDASAEGGNASEGEGSGEATE